MTLLVENLPANVGDTGDTSSIHGSGKSPGGGHGNPLQYSCLENAMGRGAWWATVRRVAKSQTLLKRLNTHTHTYIKHIPTQMPALFLVAVEKLLLKAIWKYEGIRISKAFWNKNKVARFILLI